MMKKVRSGRKSPMDGHFESAVDTLALGVFLDLGTKQSLSLFSSLYKGDYKDVVSTEVDPSTYTDPALFRKDYLAAELCSKIPCWDLGIDRESVALSKFAESEIACAETNRRLKSRNVQQLYSMYTPESFLWTARGKISRLLGPVSWARFSDHFDFGPGATYSRPSRHGDAYFKFRDKPEVTQGCAVAAYAALRDVPRWFQHAVSLTGVPEADFVLKPIEEQIADIFTIVPGNRICTVAKNAKTDRVIAVEPLMNCYIQKGIGGVIRSRLRRVGIDLDDQSTNQCLAHWGSVGGNVATIDLSGASDSVSMELVRTLLPPDWVAAIELCRSPVGVLPSGEIVSYQKVSSMGNGFTFELESLIFWALGSAVNELLRPRLRPCWVYGDDIIISTDTANTLIWILDYCGFTCNSRKTHVSGAFRESCGKHYFSGVDVTPFYIREDIASPDRVIWFCNQVRRWSRISWGLDGTLWSTWQFARGLLPSSLQAPAIPDGFGDSALIGDFDECAPKKARRGWSGWEASVWVHIAWTRQYSDVPYLLRQLSKPSKGEFVLHEYLRDFTKSKRKDHAVTESGVVIPRQRARWMRLSLIVPQWSNFGPWWIENSPCFPRIPEGEARRIVG